jgi:hypothetical protein
LRLLGQKVRPKGAFLKILKIENGTQNETFMKVWHWDPLKTILGSQRFLMVFDGPKPLKSIEKHIFSFILVIPQSYEKTMPKGISKVMFLGPKWRHGLPRFDLSFDFGRFGVMQKNDEFWTPSRWFKK